jgi:hypothetical protein
MHEHQHPASTTVYKTFYSRIHRGAEEEYTARWLLGVGIGIPLGRTKISDHLQPESKSDELVLLGVANPTANVVLVCRRDSDGKQLTVDLHSDGALKQVDRNHDPTRVVSIDNHGLNASQWTGLDTNLLAW